MAQILNPNTDQSNTGVWTASTGSNLYATIDEDANDDADFIASPAGSSNASYEAKLESGTDPLSSSGHIVRYRYAKDVSSDVVDLTVELTQAGVPRGDGIYRFNGGTTDSLSRWDNDANAIDGNESTATTSNANGPLIISSTNAPSSGVTIDSVAVYVKFGSPTTSANTLFTVTSNSTIHDSSVLNNVLPTTSSPGWVRLECSTPSGGWTWGKVQTLDLQITVSTSGFLIYEAVAIVNPTVWTYTNIGTTLTSESKTLTSAQADSITDYSDLRLKFTANTTSNTTTPTKVADRATLNSNTAITNADYVLSGMTVGNYLIIRSAADNSGGGGAARTITVTNQSGTPIDTSNDIAYQRLQDPGASSAGTTIDIVIAKITATSGTVRVAYSGSAVVAGVAEEWSGLHSTIGSLVVGTPVDNVGTASTNLASLTDSSVANKNLAYAAIAVEGPSSDTYTQDSDTTNGSWSSLTKVGTSNVTDISNQTIYGGYKVVTATGSQTYNPTINNARDSAGIIIEMAQGEATAKAKITYAQFEIPDYATNAPAGLTSGTGASNNAATALGSQAELTSATGTSNNATPSFGSQAELTSATGSSYDPERFTSSTTPSTADGTGTSNDASSAIYVNAEIASGSGSSHDALPEVFVSAQPASGTGSASDSTIAHVPAENASGSGAASNATTTIVEGRVRVSHFSLELPPAGSETNANAGVASGTGAASGATTSLSSNIEATSGSGASGSISGTVNTTANVAEGTGSAGTSSGLSEKYVDPTIATATGTASPSISSFQLNPDLTSGTGSANSPNVVDTTTPSVSAGAGASNTPAPAFEISAQTTSGTGAAYDATISYSLSVFPGTASGSGIASVASIALSATSDISSATGTSSPASKSFEVNAQHSLGSGDSFVPTTKQFGAPASDASAGSWTTTPLWSKIDEYIASDADSITSDSVIGTETSVARFTLNSLNDPGVNTDHFIRVRAKATYTVGTTGTVRVQLWNGTSSQVASFQSSTLTTSYQNFEFELSESQANAITSYSSLQIRLIGGFAGVNGGSVQVSWLQFEIPVSATSEIFAESEVASGTGSAHNASISSSTSSGGSSGTGLASGASTYIQTNPDISSGSGSAGSSYWIILASEDTATGAGSAQDADGLPEKFAEPTAAGATGVAQEPSRSISVNAQIASGTGTAGDTTTINATNASAITASGSGEVYDSTRTSSTTLNTATGTGECYDVTSDKAKSVNSGTALGSGSVSNASISEDVNTNVASASGSAYDTTTIDTSSAAADTAMGAGTAYEPSRSVSVNAEIATGAGESFAPTAGAATSANADSAGGTGSAFGATVSLETVANNSSASASANGTYASLSANVETTSGTGAVGEPDALPAKLAQPDTASGAGSATTEKVYLGVNSQTSSGTGSAESATTQQTEVADASTAIASAAAYNPTISLSATASAQVASGSATSHIANIAESVLADTGSGLGSSHSVIPDEKVYPENAAGIGVSNDPNIDSDADVFISVETATATASMSVPTFGSGEGQPEISYEDIHCDIEILVQNCEIEFLTFGAGLELVPSDIGVEIQAMNISISLWHGETEMALE